MLIAAVARYYRRNRTEEKCFRIGIGDLLLLRAYQWCLPGSWKQQYARNRHNCKTGCSFHFPADSHRGGQLLKLQFLYYYRIHPYLYRAQVVTAGCKMQIW